MLQLRVIINGVINHMSDESERVKKHNRSKMKQGYKNISFKVSPEEYKMIKIARKRYKMCDRELMMYLVSGERDRDMVENLGEGFDTNEYRYRNLPRDEYYQKMQDANGKAHKFSNKKDHILLAYLSIDKKKVKFIKDFDTWEEAQEYEDTYLTKRRTSIFYKVQSDLDWYLTH